MDFLLEIICAFSILVLAGNLVNGPGIPDPEVLLTARAIYLDKGENANMKAAVEGCYPYETGVKLTAKQTKTAHTCLIKELIEELGRNTKFQYAGKIWTIGRVDDARKDFRKEVFIRLGFDIGKTDVVVLLGGKEGLKRLNRIAYDAFQEFGLARIKLYYESEQATANALWPVPITPVAEAIPEEER